MKNQKHTYEEYKRLLNLPLGLKIERAHMVIIESLQKFHNNAVACSWGKDGHTFTGSVFIKTIPEKDRGKQQ